MEFIRDLLSTKDKMLFKICTRGYHNDSSDLHKLIISNKFNTKNEYGDTLFIIACREASSKFRFQDIITTLCDYMNNIFCVEHTCKYFEQTNNLNQNALSFACKNDLHKIVSQIINFPFESNGNPPR